MTVKPFALCAGTTFGKRLLLSEEIMTGIYGIHNKINDKWYVGQAVDIKKRNDNELWGLRKGSMHSNGTNVYMDRAWEKYGEAAFEWVVLEECSVDLLDEREIFWIKQKDSYKNGYNLTCGGGGMRGFVPNSDTRRKMSEARKGKKRSPDACKNISLAKIGSKNPMFGKKLSKESREKMSLAQRNKPLESKPVICINTGIIYPSIGEASRILNLQKSKISLVCNSKRKTTGGYKFKFV